MTELIEESALPDNYAELKKEANRTSSWRGRLAAVEQLGHWKHEQVIDLLQHRLRHDIVYRVREMAYFKLQDLGVTVQPPVKEKGELFKGTTKILLRIKKSLPREHTFEQFKEKLKKMRIDLYDAYEGELDDEFDAWLMKQWQSK